MEPPSAFALGFDIASDEIRWATAGLARDRGEVVASPPFGLVEDEVRHAAAPPVVAAYAPVFLDGDPGSQEMRIAKLKGFALAIFRVAPLVDKAASEVDASGLALSLRDTESPKAPPLAERPQNVLTLPRRDGFELGFPILFADRQWRLEVFPLPGAFLTSQRGAVEAALLGILISLIGLVTLTSLRMVARLRRQAEKVGPYRLTARLGQAAWASSTRRATRCCAGRRRSSCSRPDRGERALARFEREVQLTASTHAPEHDRDLRLRPHPRRRLLLRDGVPRRHRPRPARRARRPDPAGARHAHPAPGRAARSPRRTTPASSTATSSPPT